MLVKRVTDGWRFFCPACSEWHVAFDNGWTFDGNLILPSISPSLRIRGWWQDRLCAEDEPLDCCLERYSNIPRRLYSPIPKSKSTNGGPCVTKWAELVVTLVVIGRMNWAYIRVHRGQISWVTPNL